MEHKWAVLTNTALGVMMATMGSILLSVTPGSGTAAAALMMAFGAVRAVGAAMMMAKAPR
jgi:hypothetical protein